MRHLGWFVGGLVVETLGCGDATSGGSRAATPAPTASPAATTGRPSPPAEVPAVAAPSGTAAAPTGAVAVDAGSPPTVGAAAPWAPPGPYAIVGGLEIAPGMNEHRHEHGGSGARVAGVTLHARATDGLPHPLRVDRLELLRAHCRRETGWDARERLKVAGYVLSRADVANDAPVIADDAPSIAVPGDGHWYSVVVGFARRELYQGCDRFGAALALRVGRVRSALEVRLRVVREEPLRRR
jgi:hypothetical protein